MLVMEYANEGNLRKCLTELTNNWDQRLFFLYKIIGGLYSIHKENLIHYDFHDGNILCSKYNSIHGVFISDYLGSYQLTKSFLKSDSIYGVLPFMAPEVLKYKSYTQASDIYSFSMIMWEFTSRIPPFNDKAHNIQLALNICKGERPEIIENTPQCYVDLMKKCWDRDPLKRPTASEILDIIGKWIFLPKDLNISENLKKNIMEFINAPIGYNNITTEPHLQACYTSHLLGFTSKELNKSLEESLEIEMKQRKNAEQKLMIAKTHYESSQIELKINQKELKEMHLAYQKIKLELVNLEQNNYNLRLNSAVQIKEANNLTEQLKQNKLANQQAQIQINQLKQEKLNLEQSNYNLRFNLAVQIKEFAEKENNLQDQIIGLQNEKQALANNLTEQLKQNKLTNQQTQIQINQLKQEKLSLQEKLTQIEVSIQDLKSQQEKAKDEKAELKVKSEEEIA
jgi:serine/threonine protein kinase